MQEQMPEQGDGLSNKVDQRDQMQARALDELAQLLQKFGWSIELEQEPVALPARVEASSIARALGHRFRSFMSPDETVYFYGSSDFLDDSAEGWRFFELALDNEAAKGDPDMEARVSAFWLKHVPIALSVTGDYAYLAVRDDGKIVEAFAPDTEGTSVVAESLPQFAERLRMESTRTSDCFVFSTWVAPNPG